MVRAACFGLGALAAAGLLSLAGRSAYPVAVVTDAVSFVACAAVLAVLVRTPRPAQGPGTARRLGHAAHRLLADRPFLALIAVTGLAVLSTDVFLVGMPVFVIDRLHGPAWLPGTLLAVNTAISATGGTLALRLTRRRSRITSMRLGAACFAVFCAASAAAAALPPGWRPAELLAATLVATAGGLVFARANALAEAAAPGPARGRYLAAFQYAFTLAGVAAPALVALFSVAIWLPWLLAGAGDVLAVVLLRSLATRLPAHAVHPQRPRSATA
jgi:hypothetical protein